MATHGLRRHQRACHALGGYIVGDVFGRGDDSVSPNETGETVLLRLIDDSGGPLVYQDEETWQNERYLQEVVQAVEEPQNNLAMWCAVRDARRCCPHSCVINRPCVDSEIGSPTG